MRSSLFISLFALALISTVSAQNDQYPLNCADCWTAARNKIAECKKLSKKDMDSFGKLTDTEIAKNHGKFDSIIPCLCALAKTAPDVLKSCANSCPPQMADGLATESRIVNEAVCNAPGTKNLETDNNNSTSGNNAASGKDSASNSSNSASAGNDSANGKSSDASLVQWSGTLVTVIAVMVSAVAF